MTKFGAETLTLNNNLFYGFHDGDAGDGGSGTCNADEFEDELECDNEENVHEVPNFVTKIDKAWFDRFTQWKALDGKFCKPEEIDAARKKAGLGDYELPFFPGKKFDSYKNLPPARINFNQSRYPHPFKEGEELMDWTQSILPMIGADGERGVQAFKSAK
jgi:hypothetical protein